MKVTVKDGNVDYHYEIIPNNGGYDIQYAGSMVGAVQKHDTWQQVSGEALPPGIFKQLVLYIEAYFDRASI